MHRKRYRIVYDEPMEDKERSDPYRVNSIRILDVIINRYFEDTYLQGSRLFLRVGGANFFCQTAFVKFCRQLFSSRFFNWLTQRQFYADCSTFI